MPSPQKRLKIASIFRLAVELGSKTLKNIIGFLKRKKELGLIYPLVTLESLKLRNEANVSSSWVALEPSMEFLQLFSGYELKNIYCSWAHLWAGDFHNNNLYNYQRENNTQVKCTMPWSSIAINWRGEVVACCYDLKYDYIIGNVGQNTILELWNSERMIELRKALHTMNHDNIRPCYSCSLVRGDVF